ncbi:GNAT family protein [Lysinibacter sp. HNR]|uniref:GNAT family N-acetyltransferase n=1 Tax=Lysinibacter sp. HNR TaxID=3031408 RepID=UPI00243505F3|nr:GNAT family protein [Lysinibacter sp. HNR]WGD36686.1 GNAT family protein [Lysinibacter sp. HNR]
MVHPYSLSEPLVTPRLSLRLMTLDDTEAILTYQADEEVTRYLPYPPRDRDTVIKKIQEHSIRDSLAQDGDYMMLLAERRSDGATIGEMYFKLDSVEHSRAEIGWVLHPQFHGHGYASEAAQALLDVAFYTMKLHRVFALLDPRNDASVSLCLRLGMQKEAHLRHDEFFKGEWADTGIYGILSDEWEERAGRVTKD